MANFALKRPTVNRITRTLMDIPIVRKDDRIGEDRQKVDGTTLLALKEMGLKAEDGIQVCWPDGTAVGNAKNFRLDFIDLVCDIALFGGEDGDALLAAVADDPSTLKLTPIVEGKDGEEAVLTGIQILAPKRPAGTNRAKVDAAFVELNKVRAYCEQRFESEADIRRRFKVPHNASKESRDYQNALQRFIKVEAKVRAEEADAGRRPAEEATAWALLQKLENGYRDPYTTVR